MRSFHAVGVGLIFLSMIVYGMVRIPEGHVQTVPGVQVRVVQPNIAQVDKWRQDKREEIFSRFLELSQRDGALDGLGSGGVTHLIWPESAVPFLLARAEDAKNALREILPDGITFMTGALRLEERTVQGSKKSREFYNSFFVMDSDLRLLKVYDKIRLVPFGEFLPFQDTLEFVGLEQLTRIRGGFSAGNDRGSIAIPGAPSFNALICYEIIFSGDVVDRQRRPGWLINVTNDAWFGNSSGPYQHLHQARVRAVEEGVAVVRVANTGVSAVIDPYGRVVQQLSLGERGVLDAGLPRKIPPTVFSVYSGGVFGALLAAALVYFILIARLDGGVRSLLHGYK